MKITPTTVKFLLALFCTIATTAVFGQVANYTWTGAANGTNLDTVGNYTINGVNSRQHSAQRQSDRSGIQEPVIWDGRMTANLNLSKGGVSWPNTGLGTFGVNFVLTANQTNDVQIISSVALSPVVGIFAITNNSPSAVLSLGDNTANQLVMITRPGIAGTVHHFVNNSTNAAVINSSVQWLTGGGVACVLSFGGTGNWIVNHNLRANNFSGPYSVELTGPGSMTWSNGGVFASALGSITILGGTMILKSAGLALNFTGSGTVTNNNSITNNGTLRYDAAAQSDTIARVISGTGQLQVSNGTLTLSGTNTYTGTTTVSGGKLFINGNNAAASTTVTGGTLGGTGALSGPVTLAVGTTLAPGSSVGKLTINSDFSIGGNLAVEVDKSLSPSNDLVVVTGLLTNTGTGTLTVANLGPALAVGDKFKLFSQPLQNGAAMTVAGEGVTWVNNLALDGSIAVAQAIPPGMLGFTNLGNAIQFLWAGNFKLQAQTNNLNAGLGTNWSDYPGGSTSPLTMPIVATNPLVFFRLISPATNICAPVTNNAPVTSIYVYSGIGGSFLAGQSYNETRAVDVTVLSPVSLIATSMTLSGINGDGLAEAVIYDSNSQSLIASAQGNLTGGTITLPISATLVSGGKYRIGFYGQLGTGTFFLPDSTPYTESSGLLRINSAYDIDTDSFPANPSLDVPQVRLDVTPHP